MEADLFYVLVTGLALAAMGYVWLIIRAFRVRIPWGFVTLFVPLLGPLAFLFVHSRRARGPLLVLLLAGVVCAVPYGVNYYQRYFVPLGPHEQLVNGELHLTLTDLKGFDYATLQGKPETVVLQMANEDVDDKTLEYLKGMNRLRSLDLNGTRVTDEGLPALVALPRLEELRLARTKITDEGFQKHLAPKESLLKLDLTGVEAVKSKTKREWKKAKPGREYVD